MKSKHLKYTSNEKNEAQKRIQKYKLLVSRTRIRPMGGFWEKNWSVWWSMGLELVLWWILGPELVQFVVFGTRLVQLVVVVVRLVVGGPEFAQLVVDGSRNGPNGGWCRQDWPEYVIIGSI